MLSSCKWELHSFPEEFIVQHEKVIIDTILSNREMMRMETERKHCLASIGLLSSWRITEILEANETDGRLARTETRQLLG